MLLMTVSVPAPVDRASVSRNIVLYQAFTGTEAAEKVGSLSENQP